MDIFAQIEQEPQLKDRRSSARRRLWLTSEGRTPSVPHTEVIIHDLSETGLLIESSVNLAVGEQVELALAEAGVAEASVVWNVGRYYGCKFHEPIPTAALSAAVLRSPSCSGDEEASEIISMAVRELRAIGSRLDRVSDQLERAIEALASGRNR